MLALDQQLEHSIAFPDYESAGKIEFSTINCLQTFSINHGEKE